MDKYLNKWLLHEYVSKISAARVKNLYYFTKIEKENDKYYKVKGKCAYLAEIPESRDFSITDMYSYEIPLNEFETMKPVTQEDVHQLTVNWCKHALSMEYYE